MEKQIIVYSYNIILLSNKNAGSTDAQNSTSDSHKHYYKQRRLTETCTSHDSACLKRYKDNLNLYLERY